MSRGSTPFSIGRSCLGSFRALYSRSTGPADVPSFTDGSAMPTPVTAILGQGRPNTRDGQVGENPGTIRGSLRLRGVSRHRLVGPMVTSCTESEAGICLRSWRFQEVQKPSCLAGALFRVLSCWAHCGANEPWLF